MMKRYLKSWTQRLQLPMCSELPEFKFQALIVPNSRVWNHHLLYTFECKVMGLKSLLLCSSNLLQRLNSQKDILGFDLNHSSQGRLLVRPHILRNKHSDYRYSQEKVLCNQEDRQGPLRHHKFQEYHGHCSHNLECKLIRSSNCLQYRYKVDRN